MNDNYGCLALIIIIIAFASLVKFAYWIESKECTAKATALNYKYDFKFFQGCVLEKPNGKKILLEQLRDFE